MNYENLSKEKRSLNLHATIDGNNLMISEPHTALNTSNREIFKGLINFIDTTHMIKFDTYLHTLTEGSLILVHSTPFTRLYMC